MIDFAIAFLNSFRTYNPDLPLCLVPFDKDADRTLKLKSTYGFSVWSDRSALRRCDEISLKFHLYAVGHYRKLALWEGCYDEFVYIDIDTVVLSNLDFLFPLLPIFRLLTSHSDREVIRKWVWKDSMETSGALTSRQFRFAANTGFFASVRGHITLDEAFRKLPEALSLAEHMELECAEQAYLNYLIVKSGKPYSSLSVLNAVADMGFPEELWGGGDIGEVIGGTVRTPDGLSPLLVHWAGVPGKKTKELPNSNLWWFYRNLKLHF